MRWWKRLEKDAGEDEDPANHTKNLSRLTTEQTNRASTDLDFKSSLEIVRVINAEDAKVVDAVRARLAADRTGRRPDCERVARKAAG